MEAERPRRVVVEGEVFDIVPQPDRPGQYAFDWVSGPNPGYGFSSQTSDRRPMTKAQLEDSIRDFLAQVDPRTGYIE